MRIEQYKILREDYSVELQKRVNEEMKEGWQPFGSITWNGNSFYQSMVVYARSAGTAGRGPG